VSLSSSVLTRGIGRLIAGALLVCTGALSQELEISISPNPVGSGARAAGMADAFLAVADDATAASWNPAGLIQLERPEVSIVGSLNAIYERLDADDHPEFNSDQNDWNADLNYLSFVYALPKLVLGHNLTVSLSYQRKYDFSRRLRLKYNTNAVLVGNVLSSFLKMDFEQTGGLSAFTPAVAVEITPRLSVGAALNIWRSSFLSENSWEQQTQTKIAVYGGVMKNTVVSSEDRYEDFSGENLTLGVLWRATEKWSLGLRHDTGFTGKADFRSNNLMRSINLPSAHNLFTGIDTQVDAAKETRKVTFPASWAAGVAFRTSDRLTLSCDVTRTDWNDYYFEDGAGRKFSLTNAAPLNQTLAKPHFDPTYTIRLGAEYVLIPKRPEEALKYLWTLRGGLFRDEEPASGARRSDPSRGSGNPEAFYGAAVGVGCQMLQRVNIDVAYQLRFGTGVNRDLVRGVEGFEEDVIQHRVLVSTVVYF